MEQTQTTLAGSFMALVKSSDEELIKEKGFRDMAELHRMVSAVDLSSPLKQRILNVWKDHDGTKRGLERVLLLTGYNQAAQTPTL